MGQIEDNSATYFRISDGKIRRTTTKDDPQAVLRTIEDRKTGEKREVYEIVLKGYTGKIETVEVREGKYGDQLYVGISDGIERVYLQMSWTSPYCRTFLEKLPNADTNRDVSIVPYQFTSDKGKQVSGTSIYYNYGHPDQEKVMSAYKQYDEDTNTSKTIGGYPEGAEGMSSEDWKIVGLQQMKFLRENVVAAFPFTKAEADAVQATEDLGSDKPKEDADDGLPF